MRTTFRLDDQLLREAKTIAAESGRSLTSLVEEALREMLLRRKQAKENPPERIELPTFDLGEPAPGFNMDSNEQWRDFLDEHDPGTHNACY